MVLMVPPDLSGFADAVVYGCFPNETTPRTILPSAGPQSPATPGDADGRFQSSSSPLSSCGRTVKLGHQYRVESVIRTSAATLLLRVVRRSASTGVTGSGSRRPGSIRCGEVLRTLRRAAASGRVRRQRTFQARGANDARRTLCADEGLGRRSLIARRSSWRSSRQSRTSDGRSGRGRAHVEIEPSVSNT